MNRYNRRQTRILLLMIYLMLLQLRVEVLLADSEPQLQISLTLALTLRLPSSSLHTTQNLMDLRRHQILVAWMMCWQKMMTPTSKSSRPYFRPRCFVTSALNGELAGYKMDIVSGLITINCGCFCPANRTKASLYIATRSFPQYMAAGCGLATIRLHIWRRSEDQYSIGPSGVAAQSTLRAN